MGQPRAAVRALRAQLARTPGPHRMREMGKLFQGAHTVVDRDLFLEPEPSGLPLLMHWPLAGQALRGCWASAGA